MNAAERSASLLFLGSPQLLEHLTPDAIERVRAVFTTTRQPIDRIVRELGLLNDQTLSDLFASHMKVATASELSDAEEGVLDAITVEFASRNAVVPLKSSSGVAFAVADPFCLAPVEAVAFHLDIPCKIVIASRPIIEEFYRQRRQEAASETLDPVDNIADAEDVDRLLDSAREAPVIKLVNRAFQRAVDEKATDIHIEPMEDTVRLRFRKDGVLETFDTVPRALASGIVSRVKILARLNIAERRLPQDGRLRASVRGQEIDFRVSTVPSIHGETIVLRILDRSNVRLELAALGYEANAIEQIRRIVKRPNGIVLLTGPTGSGKTTTLYSILSVLNDTGTKIFTVEDPIEYRLRGVTQLQVDPSIGLTFASALRSILRQDPDIILIGEIRDEETARIAVQAALTGHLVLSTLHTNSAVGAVNRLRDMGIENYLLSATLRGVIGQRLVRKTCSACRGRPSGDVCRVCDGKKHVGRQALYEIMEIGSSLQHAMNAGKSEHELEVYAVEDGMEKMVDHASRLVRLGMTTMEETSRVLDVDGGERATISL